MGIIKTVNHVELVGNVVEVRNLGTADKPFACIRVGVSGMRDDQSFFVDAKIGGKVAAACLAYLGKGDQVGVSGSIRDQSWVADDAQRRYWTVLAAQAVSFGARAGHITHPINFASWTGVGLLAEDPLSLGGGTVASMEVLVDDPLDKDNTTRMRVKCTGATATNALKYLRKGSQVAVVGATLGTDTWMAEGRKQKRIVAWASDLRFGPSPEQRQR